MAGLLWRERLVALTIVACVGGSLDNGGATIAAGMVYVNSGYGRATGQPGNLLLAFSVDGK